MPAWSAQDRDELPEPTSDISRAVHDMDRFGYCVIANAIAPTQAEKIRLRIAEQAQAEREYGLTKRDDVQTGDDGNQWVYMLINKGRIFQDLLAAQAPRAVVEHVLGPNYLLSDFAATITHPGNKQMSLHIDQWWLPIP